MSSEEFRSISELKKLLASNCKVQEVYLPVFASDAEVNIVTVVVKCLEGKTQTIGAYREEAHALREFLKTHGCIDNPYTDTKDKVKEFWAAFLQIKKCEYVLNNK